MLAETLVSDDRRSSLKRIDEAIGHLRAVPPTDPRAAVARVQEARLVFLIRHQPLRAERLLRQALDLDSGLYDAHILLWKVLDMTNRGDQVESLFWRTFELSSGSQRALCLREWFLSQFAPDYGNSDLDRQMGFLVPGEKSGTRNEFQRLLAFRNAEPEEPLAGVALARWFHREGDLQQALKILSEVAEPHAAADPWYIGALTETYLDLGRFDDAASTLARWPEPREGCEFWRLRGMIDQLARKDYHSAIAAYRKAIAVWPGPKDWKTSFRLADCLRLNGQRERAADVRKSAQYLTEELLGKAYQTRLRDAVSQIDDPRRLDVFREFYTALGRKREAECWREVVAGADRRGGDGSRGHTLETSSANR
jgi:tetratricopeptide (TPR) repeat protein